MSKLEKLIKELCPDGVEYLLIKDSVNTCSPQIKIKSNDYLLDGKYPVIDQGKEYIGGYTNENGAFPLSEYVIFGDHTCVVKYVDFEFIQGADGVKVIQPKTSNINTKYLFYCMSNIYMTADYSRHWSKMKEEYIPVPPLPVQEEIVRFLDDFTDLIAELQSELQAELQARAKQYEYYREKLLLDAEGAPVKRLGDTCRMKSGKAIKAVMLSDTPDNEHLYPCFGGNGVRGYIGFNSHNGEYPIIGRQGALCGNVNYAIGEFYATEHAVVVESLGEYDQRYLFYLLTSMNLNQYKSQGAQPGLAVGNIENLMAPVPSLDMQKRTVNILDRFDKLCNNISEGIPAEIEARQKQYEYYRNKLLTFKELGA